LPQIPLGELTALPRPLAVCKGSTTKGTEGEGEKKGEGKGKGKGRERRVGPQLGSLNPPVPKIGLYIRYIPMSLKSMLQALSKKN